MYTITHELLNNYSDECAIDTIKERKQLLIEISELKNESEQFLKTTLPLSLEIRDIMSTLINVDAAVNVKMQSRLCQIRSELSGLGHSSRAVFAYTSHQR
jgi:hypothetical protein